MNAALLPHNPGDIQSDSAHQPTRCTDQMRLPVFQNVNAYYYLQHDTIAGQWNNSVNYGNCKCLSPHEQQLYSYR